MGFTFIWPLVVVLTSALCLGGCVADVEDRFLAQRNLGHRTLEDGRIELTVDPGAYPTLEGPLQVRLWASAPTPAIAIDHTGPASTALTAIVDNVFADADWFPTVSFLGEGGDCPERAPDRLVLAPIETERTGEGVHTIRLTLPPCARIALQARAGRSLGEPSGQPLRLAMIGETKGNLDVLGAIADRLIELRESGEWAADAIVALGDLANSPERIDLDAWLESISIADLPLVVVIGEDELRGGAPLPFHEVFGRSDFTFAVGDVRCFVMDTASAEMSDSQLAYWESTMATATESIRLAFMQTPPFDPAEFRDRGFTSRIQAARLIALLGESQVDAVFTGGVGTFSENQLGGIPFYSTGGGGGPVEALSDVDEHFLRVTIQPGGEPEIEVVVEPVSQ